MACKATSSRAKTISGTHIEARSVGHLQKLNKGLENKIISLQQKLDFMVCIVSFFFKKHQFLLVQDILNFCCLFLFQTAENNRLWTISAEVDKLRAELLSLETERRVLLLSKARADELEAKLKLLDVDRKEQAALNASLESELREARNELKQVNKLFRQVRYFVLLCCLHLERNRRAAAEQEISQMREQLLANASLLASPALSRAGSKSLFVSYFYLLHF
ncbi:unnamed protein product [Gongylonema pulchrum]|uniref:Myosin_tail_1 domain-containing protein n=1 Tax=Gongylonema pulchrum TaxID=637853 RepID=A0A183DTM3_9BILA|nr:unnamed protein product [Gongylonema pulchrum]